MTVRLVVVGLLGFCSLSFIVLANVNFFFMTKHLRPGVPEWRPFARPGGLDARHYTEEGLRLRRLMYRDGLRGVLAAIAAILTYWTWR